MQQQAQQQTAAAGAASATATGAVASEVAAGVEASEAVADLQQDEAAARQLRGVLDVLRPLLNSAFLHVADDHIEIRTVGGSEYRLYPQPEPCEFKLSLLDRKVLSQPMVLSDLVDTSCATADPNAVHSDGIAVLIAQLTLAQQLPSQISLRFMRQQIPPVRAYGATEPNPPRIAKKWFFPSEQEVPPRASAHTRAWRWAAQPICSAPGPPLPVPVGRSAAGSAAAGSAAAQSEQQSQQQSQQLLQQPSQQPSQHQSQQQSQQQSQDSGGWVGAGAGGVGGELSTGSKAAERGCVCGITVLVGQQWGDPDSEIRVKVWGRCCHLKDPPAGGQRLGASTVKFLVEAAEGYVAKKLGKGKLNPSTTRNFLIDMFRQHAAREIIYGSFNLIPTTEAIRKANARESKRQQGEAAASTSGGATSKSSVDQLIGLQNALRAEHEAVLPEGAAEKHLFLGYTSKVSLNPFLLVCTTNEQLLYYLAATLGLCRFFSCAMYIDSVGNRARLPDDLLQALGIPAALFTTHFVVPNVRVAQPHLARSQGGRAGLVLTLHSTQRNYVPYRDTLLHFRDILHGLAAVQRLPHRGFPPAFFTDQDGALQRGIAEACGFRSTEEHHLAIRDACLLYLRCVQQAASQLEPAGRFNVEEQPFEVADGLLSLLGEALGHSADDWYGHKVLPGGALEEATATQLTATERQELLRVQAAHMEAARAKLEALGVAFGPKAQMVQRPAVMAGKPFVCLCLSHYIKDHFKHPLHSPTFGGLAKADRQYWALVEGLLMAVPFKLQLFRGPHKLEVLLWYNRSLLVVLSTPAFNVGQHLRHAELGPFLVVRAATPADQRPNKPTPRYVYEFPRLRTLKDKVVMFRCYDRDVVGETISDACDCYQSELQLVDDMRRSEGCDEDSLVADFAAGGTAGGAAVGGGAAGSAAATGGAAAGGAAVAGGAAAGGAAVAGGAAAGGAAVAGGAVRTAAAAEVYEVHEPQVHGAGVSARNPVYLAVTRAGKVSLPLSERFVAEESARFAAAPLLHPLLHYMSRTSDTAAGASRARTMRTTGIVESINQLTGRVDVDRVGVPPLLLPYLRMQYASDKAIHAALLVDAHSSLSSAPLLMRNPKSVGAMVQQARAASQNLGPLRQAAAHGLTEAQSSADVLTWMAANLLTSDSGVQLAARAVASAAGAPSVPSSASAVMEAAEKLDEQQLKGLRLRCFDLVPGLTGPLGVVGSVTATGGISQIDSEGALPDDQSAWGKRRRAASTAYSPPTTTPDRPAATAAVGAGVTAAGVTAAGVTAGAAAAAVAGAVVATGASWATAKCSWVDGCGMRRKAGCSFQACNRHCPGPCPAHHKLAPSPATAAPLYHQQQQAPRAPLLPQYQWQGIYPPQHPPPQTLSVL